MEVPFAMDNIVLSYIEWNSKPEKQYILYTETWYYIGLTIPMIWL